MAVIRFYAEFDYPAPKPEVLVAKISEVSGLKVSIVSSHQDDLHEQSLEIIFDEYPKNILEIYSYCQGAIKKSIEEEVAETGYKDEWTMSTEGADEPEGRQRIYVNGYLGQEITLMSATAIALEDLGGTDVERFEGNDKNQFPITINELNRRYKKHNWVIRLSFLKFILLLPIMIPIGIIKMFISLIMMPFEIRKAYKEVIEKHLDIKNKK